MKRLGVSLGLSASLLAGGGAWAAERQAVVQGVTDRILRTEIEQALTEEKTAPASRVDARHRAPRRCGKRQRPCSAPKAITTM